LYVLTQKVPVVLIEKYPVKGTKIQLISESFVSVLFKLWIAF